MMASALWWRVEEIKLYVYYQVNTKCLFGCGEHKKPRRGGVWDCQSMMRRRREAALDLTDQLPVGPFGIDYPDAFELSQRVGDLLVGFDLFGLILVGGFGDE
jgi:hypothetical protein